MNIREVRFRQSGGFAGLIKGSEVAGDALSADEQRALERLGKKASGGAASESRDLVVFELEVDSDSGTTRLEFDESAVPKEIAALVERLQSQARPMKP